MKYRPRRTIPAVVVATLLLAACVLVALSAIQLLLGHSPLIPVDRLVSAGHRLHWHDIGVIAAGVVVATAGLLLLAAAVLPGAPIVLPLDDHPGAGGQVAAGVTRRSLRKTLLHSAETTDGVTSARLRLHRRRVTITVRSHRLDLAGLDGRVQEAVDQRLDSIELAERPTLHVRVTAARNRRWTA
ncbi:DUF6286 domain-containing protein [Amycolatopsis mongoliensis]|uniref:DUF6286 domain-containing protein n=1 Tax=Amycolatopsis mongoliensis TaxID=715475 RepID=A0A9Y2NA17_9PSEU|nr:DUF6286 domain-containing protein [Amycolatopsis sp. 4-36]WIX98140.1 DUF6286 domain-containing protein [Amycolatopsis sp. 4-36]